MGHSLHTNILMHSLQAVIAFVLMMAAHPATAAVHSTAGVYRLAIATEPRIVPVGDTRLRIRIADKDGKPLVGLGVSTIARMPGMPMGETEIPAAVSPDKPGVYTANARFPMAGAYELTISVAGPQGNEKAVVPINTGQDTGVLDEGGAGPGIPGYVFPLVLLLAALAFIAHRMRATGQRVNLRRLLTMQTMLGIGLLASVYIVSTWVVRKYTEPGHMSVIEAQAMDMSVMKPPTGATPVAVVTAKRGPIEATVRYSGSVVPFQEQLVTARVPGSIVWMSAYPGMRVKRGEVIARLDTSELRSRVAEEAANVNMAQHQREISTRLSEQSQHTAKQADAQIAEAQSEVAASRSDLSAARQETTAAQEERKGVQSDVASAQAAATDAEAQLSAARADDEYWSNQIKRSSALVSEGVISRRDFQQDQASAANARSKVLQAEARIKQASATISSAQARLKRADAMILSAEARAQAMQAKLDANQSKVAQLKDASQALYSSAAASEHQVAHSEAGVREAQAKLKTSQVVEGYTEIRADIDGVVTQRLLSPGQLVQPGQTILKVAQISPIRLQANVSEVDLANIKIGSKVSVTGSIPATASVTAVFPGADPVARTSIVEAVFENKKQEFVPGQFVSMDITTANQRNAVVVPASAVVWQAKATSEVMADAQTASVWVVGEGQAGKTIYTCTMHPNVQSEKPGKCPECGWELTPISAGGKWRAHLLPVVLGVRNQQSVEIRQGLEAGRQVISAGLEGLHEDDPVVPTAWGPQGAVSLPPATGEIAPGAVFTCLMHPEVQSDKPGDCPKCGMRLVPKQNNALGSSSLSKSPGASSTLYTCPMHPNVRAKSPGKCPECGMDLVPAAESGGAK